MSEDAVAAARQSHSHGRLTFHAADGVSFLCATSSNWDVLFAFESFHLFLDDLRFPSALARVLAPGARLVVGWRHLEWEDDCREAIAATCAGFGVPFGDWGYWTCPRLASQLAAAGMRVRDENTITIATAHQSSLSDVVDFVSGVDRVNRAVADQLPEFRRSLEKAIRRLAREGTFQGEQLFRGKVVFLE